MILASRFATWKIVTKLHVVKARKNIETFKQAAHQ